MEHCKLQIGCLVVLFYISFVYIKEQQKYHKKLGGTFFSKMLLLGILCVMFDGITAYTVNNLETVNPMFNMILHAFFLISIDSVIFCLFLYMLSITRMYPKSALYKTLLFAPFILNLLVVVLNINTLEYRVGKVTNYSMGVSAYTCFVMVAIYIILSLVVFFLKRKMMKDNERSTIFIYLVMVTCVTAVQMIFPETLISSIAVTSILLGIYVNLENFGEYVRDTFGKIVDPNIRDYLLKDNIALGGEICEATVMFCDIRNFTALSEEIGPERIVSILNRLFSIAENCISKYNGIINKYIGDSMLVIFGVPVKIAEHELNAFNAANAILTSLESLNRDFEIEGLPCLKIGIGIHTGEVLAGNIGAKNRMEYTVMGDTVNTASRIESLCKSYNKALLVSETTYKSLKENGIELEFVANSEIRGKQNHVGLYCLG